MSRVTLMDMGLITEEGSTNPAPTMAKRSSAPRKRLNGVQVPVHIDRLLEQIRELENAAYIDMGGESKKSLSDIVSEALELYVSAWIRKYGAVPEDATERAKFTKALATSHLRELRSELLGIAEPQKCPTCGQPLTEPHKH